MGRYVSVDTTPIYAKAVSCNHAVVGWVTSVTDIMIDIVRYGGDPSSRQTSKHAFPTYIIIFAPSDEVCLLLILLYRFALSTLRISTLLILAICSYTNEHESALSIREDHHSYAELYEPDKYEDPLALSPPHNTL